MEIFVIRWICITAVCLAHPLIEILYINLIKNSWVERTRWLQAPGARARFRVERVEKVYNMWPSLTAADKSSEWQRGPPGFIAVGGGGGGGRRWRCSSGSPTLLSLPRYKVISLTLGQCGMTSQSTWRFLRGSRFLRTLVTRSFFSQLDKWRGKKRSTWLDDYDEHALPENHFFFFFGLHGCSRLFRTYILIGPDWSLFNPAALARIRHRSSTADVFRSVAIITQNSERNCSHGWLDGLMLQLKVVQNESNVWFCWVPDRSRLLHAATSCCCCCCPRHYVLARAFI